MYSSESFHVTELMLKKMTKMRRLSDKEKMDLKNALNKLRDRDRKEKTIRDKSTQKTPYNRNAKLGSKANEGEDNFTHQNRSVLATLFVEELDIILAASEDGNIYVWGFDDSAVAVLQKMKLTTESEDVSNEVSGLEKYAILLKGSLSMGEGAMTTGQEPKTESMKLLKEEESVSNRVAGFICKYILTEHKSCVTSMCVIRKAYGFDNTYLVSSGWDHRLCIWNLDDGSLHSTFKDRTSQIQEVKGDEETKTSEWAADGIITCMQYNPDQNEIAYGSSDHMVHIRKFSPDGSQMPLLNTLQHDGEITALKWNPMTKQWVSGSDDGTIKIWSGVGMNDLIQTLSEKSAVTCLCIDALNGAIIAGLQNVIKVYDSERFRLMQTNVGHTDSVRDIVHIPERNQYVSCSWDKTIRIWNEWKQVKKRVVEDQKDTSGTTAIRDRRKHSKAYQNDEDKDDVIDQ